ncbi:endonuclease/exonuclease/phosphatase family protein [Zhouia spongiae]|uniref:Endonuclease/exonuclease/phosphatase family protein n=2 Tax=Zhouia spongiae TaxID=2202721 RepID=A0ABY3YRJ2_9FLAO|nr:endonuclease/exonuclease/phosphatase family protein [Zhouia spongiae]UNZ00485.1 endonuclease/exonuclease/phosphatase family protein [Zhouia spongiae]
MFRNLICILLIITGQNVLCQELSVLSYNIKYDNPDDNVNNWNDRKDFLIAQLKFNEPDVFGTQEGLINQLKEIDKGLNDYAFIGIGRDHGDERGEHTAIFYNKKRVGLIDHKTFWLSETPGVPSKGWDAALNRICTYAVFQLQNSGNRFLVFNTHFDHVGDVARLESCKLILQKIKEVNTEGLPVVLMGDFNLENDREGIKYLANYLTDSHVEAGVDSFGPEGTFNGFNFNEPVKKRIDFIFISGLKVLKSAIFSDSKNCKYPSDHFPVYSLLEFDKK